MRLNRQERAALVLLEVHGPSHGLDLILGSFGLLARGSVYVHLAALVDRGWVSRIGVHCAVIGRPRHLFELTPKGRIELALLRERWGRA